MKDLRNAIIFNTTIWIKHPNMIEELLIMGEMIKYRYLISTISLIRGQSMEHTTFNKRIIKIPLQNILLAKSASKVTQPILKTKEKMQKEKAFRSRWATSTALTIRLIVYWAWLKRTELTHFEKNRFLPKELSLQPLTAQTPKLYKSAKTKALRLEVSNKVKVSTKIIIGLTKG